MMSHEGENTLILNEIDTLNISYMYVVYDFRIT